MTGQCEKSALGRSETNREIPCEITCDATPRKRREPRTRRSCSNLAPLLFAWRALRPLWWFGLVECVGDSEDLEDASWRKSALFDRFLGFDADVVRTEGSLH